ncbi:MAG: zf-TFIIB domain-containing protein [Pseudomonadota bacterium]
MPLISSPIDGSMMHEVERYGVKIDVCQASGGIWLDKGEFEKIVRMVREEALQDHTSHNHSQSFGGRREEPRRERQSARQEPERESIFESLLDLF